MNLLRLGTNLLVFTLISCASILLVCSNQSGAQASHHTENIVSLCIDSATDNLQCNTSEGLDSFKYLTSDVVSTLNFVFLCFLLLITATVFFLTSKKGYLGFTLIQTSHSHTTYKETYWDLALSSQLNPRAP